MKLEHLELKFAIGDLSGKPDGFIAGIASTPRLDTHNDIVLPGAFSESIAKRGQGGFGGPDGIAMLAHHDAEDQIGVWDVIEQRGDNLYAEGRLNLEIDEAKEIHSLIKMGAAIGFSIGFRVSERKFTDDGDATIRTIIKGDIREISVVTFPANEDCAVLAVKSAKRPPVHEIKFDAPSDFVKWVADEFAVSRRMAKRLFDVAKQHAQFFSPLDGREPREEVKPGLSVVTDYSAALKQLSEIKNAEIAALIKSQAASI